MILWKWFWGWRFGKVSGRVRNVKSVENLDIFERVFLQDSTQIKLSEKLSEFFKGSGGSASKSLLKIDLLYELHSEALRKHTDNRLQGAGPVAGGDGFRHLSQRRSAYSGSWDILRLPD